MPLILNLGVVDLDFVRLRPRRPRGLQGKSDTHRHQQAQFDYSANVHLSEPESPGFAVPLRETASHLHGAGARPETLGFVLVPPRRPVTCTSTAFECDLRAARRGAADRVTRRGCALSYTSINCRIEACV